MALDFVVKDVIHRVTAKFVPAYLPEAKKAFYLKAVNQQELDIHEVASKAAVYNIEADPRVIEDGFNAACELILYLLADGFKVRTPLARLSTRLPGEYFGTETGLPDGVFPQLRAHPSRDAQEYIRSRTRVLIDGTMGADGYIGRAVDGSDGTVNMTMTENTILTIYGYGLRIGADAEHAGQEGLTFESDDPAYPSVKASVIAVNEPKMIKVLVPPQLGLAKSYYLKIVTQTSAKSGGTLLKNLREVRSEFKLKAFKREAPAAGLGSDATLG